MQPTKGPWIVDATRECGPMLIFSSSSDVPYEHSIICSFNVIGLPAAREEIEANARLLVASPDLLDVVKEFLECFPYIVWTPIDVRLALLAQKARDTLAKVTLRK